MSELEGILGRLRIILLRGVPFENFVLVIVHRRVLCWELAASFNVHART